MKIRRNKYREESPVEYLLLRERLGLGRYRKTKQRDPEKRRLLLKLNLCRIEEAEKDDFTLIGDRRRRLSLK